VKAAAHGGEYGRMAMNIQPDSKCFAYLGKDVKSVNVWMSHGDEAVKLPEGFKAVAMSQQVRCGRAEEPHQSESTCVTPAVLCNCDKG